MNFIKGSETVASQRIFRYVWLPHVVFRWVDVAVLFMVDTVVYMCIIVIGSTKVPRRGIAIAPISPRPKKGQVRN